MAGHREDPLRDERDDDLDDRAGPNGGTELATGGATKETPMGARLRTTTQTIARSGMATVQDSLRALFFLERPVTERWRLSKYDDPAEVEWGPALQWGIPDQKTAIPLENHKRRDRMELMREWLATEEEEPGEDLQRGARFFQAKLQRPALIPEGGVALTAPRLAAREAAVQVASGGEPLLAVARQQAKQPPAKRAGPAPPPGDRWAWPSPPALAAILARWRCHRRFRWRFSGDPASIHIFLFHLEGYMADFGHTFRDDGDRIRFVGNCLKGEAARWYVNLYRYAQAEVRDYDRFLRHMREYFEDPFEVQTAEKNLNNLRQGAMTVGQYAWEFRKLASSIPHWTEAQRVEAFRRGLRKDVVQMGLLLDDPKTVMGWVRLAGDVERRMHRMAQLRKGKHKGEKKPATPKRNPPPKSSTPDAAERARRRKKGLCLGCGGRGHFLADCPSEKASGATGEKPSGKATAGKPLIYWSSSTSESEDGDEDDLL
ncbi:uncharacterized protein LOC143833454 [Paroedura picta]|uniref:uncharacterized protein LOC143833454 n=1 Tax=Paroedura picta TaxID=143630 RepID=UPI0040565FF4